jgi:hypothetical protein
MPVQNHIKYKCGYKYQLYNDYIIKTDIRNDSDIYTFYIYLFKDGTLVIKKGYAWDGASGPTIDTKSSMRASLVHDALYQLIRYGLLSISYRNHIDMLFKVILIEDGMNKVRANLWYKSVKCFAEFACLPKSKRIIHTAP